MPPRKSGASVADLPPDTSMISEASGKPTIEKPETPKPDAPKPEKKKKDDMTIEDLLLPRTITQRICKGVLPSNTSIHKDAALALTKSATVFISLLAAEANDLTDRKTIQSQDVLKALREIEMEHVMQLGVLGDDGKRGGRVEREIEKWEGDVRGKRRGYRDRVKARESGAGNITLGETTLGADVEDGDEQDSKRLRMDDESTAPIVNGTGKLNMDGEEEEEPDDVEDEEEDEDEEESEDEPEEEEMVDAVEIMDVDEDRHQNRGTLAPDGRVEVGGSDDESD